MISSSAVKIFTRYSFRCIKTKHLNQNYVAANFHRCCTVTSEATLTTPQTSNVADRQYPTKIEAIVKDISKLTILEVADLNQLLKKTLNIPDAPVMSMGFAAAAAPVEKEDEQAVASVKSSFTVKLTKFDESKKIQLIKEIKSIIEGLNLVQAKKFVESIPQIIKADISKDEAEKIQKAIEAAGGIVVID